ncbi:MAG: GntR family transcriptional regulator [Bulleidia sp.]
MPWKFDNERPIYLQMVDVMSMRIANQTYKPGAKMPAVRELALEAGVNPNTVQRVFAELERRGVLYTERTTGRYVCRDAVVLEELKEHLSQTYIDEMLRHLRELGLSDEAIQKTVVKRMEEVEK